MIAMILSRNIAAVYSQTLTAISIFKYVNIVCIIQVHTLYAHPEPCPLQYQTNFAVQHRSAVQT